MYMQYAIPVCNWYAILRVCNICILHTAYCIHNTQYTIHNTQYTIHTVLCAHQNNKLQVRQYDIQVQLYHTRHEPSNHQPRRTQRPITMHNVLYKYYYLLLVPGTSTVTRTPKHWKQQHDSTTARQHESRVLLPVQKYGNSTNVVLCRRGLQGCT
jgi:hypothetical protein